MATHGEKRWPPAGRFSGRLRGAFHGHRHLFRQPPPGAGAPTASWAPLPRSEANRMRHRGSAGSRRPVLATFRRFGYGVMRVRSSAPGYTDPCQRSPEIGGVRDRPPGATLTGVGARDVRLHLCSPGSLGNRRPMDLDPMSGCLLIREQETGRLRAPGPRSGAPDEPGPLAAQAVAASQDRAPIDERISDRKPPL